MPPAGGEHVEHGILKTASWRQPYGPLRVSLWLEFSNVKVLGNQTNGAYSLLEIVVPPGGGPPLHVHHNEEEAFYVIEGELKVQVWDREAKASAGSFVLLPKNIPHAFRIEDSRPAKVLALLSPPGFEGYFIDYGRPAEANALPPPTDVPPDLEKMVEVAARYGSHVVGPPLSP